MGAWLKPNLGRRDQRSDSFAAPGTAPVFDAFCGCQPPSGPIVFSLNTEVHFPPLQSRWFFLWANCAPPAMASAAMWSESRVDAGVWGRLLRDSNHTVTTVPDLGCGKPRQTGGAGGEWRHYYDLQGR